MMRGCVGGLLTSIGQGVGGSSDFPDIGNVLNDDTVNGLAGTFVPPDPSRLAYGYQCGENGVEITGTMLTVPDVPTDDFTRMRAAYDATLLDSCKIGILTEDVTGTYKEKSYLYGSEIMCGYKEYREDESEDGAQAPVIDAIIRLPWSTTVTNQNRIRMTKRYGTAITNVDYSVVGPVIKGLEGVEVKVALVTSGSKR